MSKLQWAKIQEKLSLHEKCPVVGLHSGDVTKGRLEFLPQKL